MHPNRLRWWTRAGAFAALVVALTACSTGGPEAELRAEMEAAGLSGESIDCLVDAFDISSLAQLEEGSLPTDAAAGECVRLVFAEMFAGAFEELGDAGWDTADGSLLGDENMDVLADACRNGDNEACDDLWLVSPIGSPEEELAEKCGGRSPEPRMGSCSFWLDD